MEVLVLYGSQTGTAQDVAERLRRRVRMTGLRCPTMPMDVYCRLQLIREQFAVFVCSTTGQGDEPDNMRHFWRFLLRKSLPSDALHSLSFSVLGLGDSSYLKYNYVAKKLHRRLEQLGAHPVLPLALADDQHHLGPEATISQWMTQLLGHLKPFLPQSATPHTQVLPPKYQVEIVGDTDERCTEVKGHTVGALPSRESPFMATLVENHRLTSSGHFQDVRLITFNIEGSGIRYSAGDVVMIQPQNTPQAVEEFISVLNLDPSALVCLKQNDPDLPVPSLPPLCSVRELVARHLDMQCVPHNSFFELLLCFARDQLEKEKLEEFTSLEGQEELLSYCTRPRRTITEVLQDFPATAKSVPFPYLFDLIPSLLPRAFSIASSMTEHGGELQIAMAVVAYRTAMHRVRRGVCSTWLSQLVPLDPATPKVPLWVVPGSLRFPVGQDSHVIMVGPGTGCAPFRAYLEERVARKECGNMLFFGCRLGEADFLFREEWRVVQRDHGLLLFTAFSRTQEHKVYVQHVLLEHGDLVWDWIHRKHAYVFIAGNAKQMPLGVLNALKETFQVRGSMSEQEASQLLASLQNKRLIQLETWA